MSTINSRLRSTLSTRLNSLRTLHRNLQLLGEGGHLLLLLLHLLLHHLLLLLLVRHHLLVLLLLLLRLRQLALERLVLLRLTRPH